MSVCHKPSIPDLRSIWDVFYHLGAFGSDGLSPLRKRVTLGSFKLGNPRLTYWPLKATLRDLEHNLPKLNLRH